MFVYSDQLLGHYKNQIEKSEGNADEIQAKMKETAGTKDGAFDAMSRRYNDEGNEGNEGK